MEVAPKQIIFSGSALESMKELPETVRREFGHALWMVQKGETPGNAKPFEGSHASEIMKLVERFDDDTYRAVYAAKFDQAVFVLHVFKKKASSGIRTPQKDINLVHERFLRAKQEYGKEFPTQAATRKPETKKAKL